MTTLRPFEDLIKPIEFEGETFIPIEEIAMLAFDANLTHSEVKVNSKEIVTLYVIINKKYGFRLIVREDFNIHAFDNDCLIETIDNQVQIVKNLIKWGFVEP
jgi:hypothetical protein